MTSNQSSRTTGIIVAPESEKPLAPRMLKYWEALREAMDQALAENEQVFVIGEGVPDPKGIFGTTLGLRQKYGPERVSDMPLSENALTGVCIGASLLGIRPVLIHQRLDFSLLSLDQIINNAAKWFYMFGGQLSVPIVIRMVIGMGWGQGAQHSQSLQALFAHIPGLKVVMPSTPYDVKGLLLASIRDNNPVIFIEHRWLHNSLGPVPEKPYLVPLGKGNLVRQGSDLTIVATSIMTLEALRAMDLLQQHGITADVIDVRTLKPFDLPLVLDSVHKTGRLLVLDSGHYTGGFAGEVVAQVAENAFSVLKSPPQRITLPDFPSPSTPGLTKYYYPRYKEVVFKVLEMVGKDMVVDFPEEKTPHDVPDETFTGPF